MGYRNTVTPAFPKCTYLTHSLVFFVTPPRPARLVCTLWAPPFVIHGDSDNDYRHNNNHVHDRNGYDDRPVQASARCTCLRRWLASKLLAL